MASTPQTPAMSSENPSRDVSAGTRYTGDHELDSVVQRYRASLVPKDVLANLRGPPGRIRAKINKRKRPDPTRILGNVRVKKEHKDQAWDALGPTPSTTRKDSNIKSAQCGTKTTRADAVASRKDGYRYPTDGMGSIALTALTDQHVVIDDPIRPGPRMRYANFTMSLETATALYGKGNFTGTDTERRCLWRMADVEAPYGRESEVAVADAPLDVDLIPEVAYAPNSEKNEEDYIGMKLEIDDDLPHRIFGKLGRLDDELPTIAKRPRGRPRKHPLPTREEIASKAAKGRSKTGCITCRKRKKKCDEAKPHCMNCEKNAVVCEGYAPLQVWKSGREKASSEALNADDHHHTPSSATLSRSSSRVQSLGLSSIIHGVENAADRMLFNHYLFHLSTTLTVQGGNSNAFKEQLLPMAMEHLGLMHSVLALSAAHIDWKSAYGKNLLEQNPEVSVDELQQRGYYHDDAAFRELNADIRKQQALESRGEPPDDAITKVRFGQMLCYVVKSIAEGNTTGQHRWHLQAYQRLIRENPPPDCDFMKFVHEYFRYHICFDHLIAPVDSYITPPSTPPQFQSVPSDGLGSVTPPIFNQNPDSLFGLQSEVYFDFMQRISTLRNDIRYRMDNEMLPHVDYMAAFKATAIDAEIRAWAGCDELQQPTPDSSIHEGSPGPSTYRGQKHDVCATLYKQMLWVYLWRTLYPPSTTAGRSRSRLLSAPTSPVSRSSSHDSSQKPRLSPDLRIKQAVDAAIAHLQTFAPDDPYQAMLLSPAFLLGCAAFEDEQRTAIRTAVTTIRNFTTLRNADIALQVLVEVWRRMDQDAECVGKNESWDWQRIAKEMGVDFLAT